MRILQVINSLGTGGAEKLLLDTIPLYRQRGIEMDILVLWNNEHLFTTELISAGCCQVFVLHNSNKVSDIYRLGNIHKMAKIMKDYDVVHVHLFPAQYFAVLANKLNRSRSKLIFTEHNTTNSRIQSKVFRILDRYFYKRYQHMIYISDEISAIFNGFFPFLSKMSSVIQNGVDLYKIIQTTSYPKPDLLLDIEEGDCLLIQVSAFRAQKDQRTLIKAMKYLGSDAKLILVGDGELRPELENYVKEEGLESSVFFLGQRMDVAALLKSADVVVLSSHYEGLSLASIEGLASGKPFVASDVPGLRDIVDGAGLLFTLGDAEHLAQIIQELIDNPQYAQSVATRGKERAKQYDISTMVQKHIALYKGVFSTPEIR